IIPVWLGMNMMMQGALWSFQTSVIAKQPPSGPSLLLALSGFFLFLYLSARLLCFAAIIIDRDLPTGEALRQSWDLTRSNPFTLMGLLFLFQMISETVGLGFGLVTSGLLAPLESVMGEPGLAVLIGALAAALAASCVSLLLAVFSAFYYRAVSISD
ncbi:MAG: hypothetical protein RL367_1180, partial [Pseudomonadota bacterium]